jgi:hypothetical protein
VLVLVSIYPLKTTGGRRCSRCRAPLSLADLDSLHTACLVCCHCNTARRIIHWPQNPLACPELHTCMYSTANLHFSCGEYYQLHIYVFFGLNTDVYNKINMVGTADNRYWDLRGSASRMHMYNSKYSSHSNIYTQVVYNSVLLCMEYTNISVLLLGVFECTNKTNTSKQSS